MAMTSLEMDFQSLSIPFPTPDIHHLHFLAQYPIYGEIKNNTHAAAFQLN